MMMGNCYVSESNASSKIPNKFSLVKDNDALLKDIYFQMIKIFLNKKDKSYDKFSLKRIFVNIETNQDYYYRLILQRQDHKFV